MASYSYSFELHCKGEQGFIEEFRSRVKEIAFANFASCDLGKTPSSMSFLLENTQDEFYKPFIPLIEEFTEENNKPLSFFFHVLRKDNTFDRTLECGYAIFERGELVDEDSEIIGEGGGNNDIRRNLADWLGVECDISEDAPDEMWLDELLYHFNSVLSGEDLDAQTDEEYRTLEVCLAAVSYKRKGQTFEEIEKDWEKHLRYIPEVIPYSLREKAEELALKGYDLGQLIFIPNYLRAKVLDVLISGKGFSEDELYEKIKQYTATDVENHKEMLEQDGHCW